MAKLRLPDGFRAGGLWAGLKRAGRGLDLGLVVAERATPAAAVFTRNRLLGAHVPVCREHLERSGGLVRAVLVNSGNANCATGERGREDARLTCRAVAECVGCPEHHVLPVSTGVIGAPLPVDRMLAAIPRLCEAVRDDGAEAFTEAILTTDTRGKFCAADVATGAAKRSCIVAGIAKGSGMIHPDLATMLAFLLTDARLGDAPAALLGGVVDRTFHRLSVDGDTSPNDTVLLWTSAEPAAHGDAVEDALEGVLVDVSTRLCRMIAADGEGASRLVTVEVRGAASEADAVRVGRLIATSPLVKTAVAGRDPNWGRILSVAGRANTALDISRARVWVGDSVVFEEGGPRPEREERAFGHLRDDFEVRLGVDLGVGAARADVWTCDLTADYVRINADYRT